MSHECRNVELLQVIIKAEIKDGCATIAK